MQAPSRRIVTLCCIAVLVVHLGWLSSPTYLLEARKLPASGDDAEARELTRLQAYRRYIFSVDMAALQAVFVRSRRPAPVDAARVDRPRAKIAFLFLLHDTVDQEAVWDKFFAAADPALFTVYVHRASPMTSMGSFQRLANTRDVPFTSSAWCALMGVEFAMLQEALRDPLNQQFVFLSHNTVPLKSFRYVYEDLVAESGNTSKFCFASQPRPSIRGRDCRFQDWNRMHLDHVLKHHQWIVLSRQHAEVLLIHAEAALRHYDSLREIDSRRRFRDIKMCSDETVPVLALFEHARALANASLQGLATGLRGSAGGRSGVGRHQVVSSSSGGLRSLAFVELEAIGVEQRCVTFAYWQLCLQDSPLDLQLPRWHVSIHPHDFRTVEAPYLRGLVNSSLLFARKFGREAMVLERGSNSSELIEDVERPIAAAAGMRTISASFAQRPLAEVLPALWREVEFERGAREPFVRLETATGLDS